MSNTIIKLSHAKLEQAIYQKTPLDKLIGHIHPALARYRVVDYVGSHQIETERYARHDVVKANAEIFFEDQGQFIARHPGEEWQQTFDLSVFATFIVIEIRPNLDSVEFLILAPSGVDAELPYAGLVNTQNTDALQQQLSTDSALRENCFNDCAQLINTLQAEAPRAQKKAGFLRKLFGSK